jgi:hypothetical protein
MALAKELADLRPDVIFGQSTPAIAALARRPDCCSMSLPNVRRDCLVARDICFLMTVALVILAVVVSAPH